MTQRQFIVETTVTVKQVVSVTEDDVNEYTYGETSSYPNSDDLEPEFWTNTAAGIARVRLAAMANDAPNPTSVIKYGESAIEEDTV